MTPIGYDAQVKPLYSLEGLAPGAAGMLATGGLLLLGLVAHGEVTLWRSCQAPAPAYAAAWFARRDTLQETSFGDKLGMEYHDYFMFNQGGNGRPRICLKSADAGAFFVNHLSGLEHALGRGASKRGLNTSQAVEIQTARVERLCEAEEPKASYEHDVAVVAVIPFWGGRPERDNDGHVIGNSHSQLDRTTKTRQLRAVACSIRKVIGTVRVIVGVANADDLRSVQSIREEAWLVKVKHGAHLAFTLLRELQQRVEDGSMRCDYVYFTEADQVLYGSVDIRDLMGAVGQHVYVAPNRLEEASVLGRTVVSTPGAHYQFVQNICSGEVIATLRASSRRPPQLLPVNKVRERGARVTTASPGAPERPLPAGDEIAEALQGVHDRLLLFRDEYTAGQNARFTYASAISKPPKHPELVQTTSSYGNLTSAFARCWNTHEKHMPTWFAHAKSMLGANFERLTDPLKSISVLAVALDELKLASAWHSWSLATFDPTDFAVCKQCRGRWPPHEAALKRHRHRRHTALDGLPRRERRQYDVLEERRHVEDRRQAALINTTEDNHPCTMYSPSGYAGLGATLANRSEVVALMPLEGRLVDQAALASICVVREILPALIVGYCANDRAHVALVARLVVRLGEHYFESRAFDCVDPSASAASVRRETSAALPLVKYVVDRLKGSSSNLPAWGGVSYFLFAPLGDLIAIHDLNALKAAVSAITFLVPYRYHDTKDGLDTTLARPLDCERDHRDWLLPLNAPNRRRNVNADMSAYLLYPR